MYDQIIYDIEREANLCIATGISGISFELHLKREHSVPILTDMMHYIPAEDIQTGHKKAVKLYYIQNRERFNEMREGISGEKGDCVTIYHSRTIHKTALHYQKGDMDIYFCESDPYFVLLKADKIYVILHEMTKSANRLYFRLMIEFVLRAKVQMGFHLIHAASVSVGGRGLLICGNKGAGKTTLLTHLLKSKKADFIANDKVLLSPDLKQIHYYPLVARVGEGTVRKFMEYDLSNRFYRISEKEKQMSKENLSNEKWEFTPWEMTNLFDCGYTACSEFHALIISHIKPDFGDCVRAVPASADVLDFEIGVRDGVDNWLLNSYWLDYYKNLPDRKAEGKESNYLSYQMEYGYDAEEKAVIGEVNRILKQGTTKAN